MNRYERQIVLAQIRKHEGLRLKPYQDSVGKTTIGIGRNLDDRGVTAEEAAMMALNDIKAAHHELWVNFPWYNALTGDRKYAWINLCFNMGMPRLKGFKMAIAAMEQSKYSVAADEILDSKYARQVGQRAIDIANMIRRG
jgi:lysozyme